MGGHSYKRDVAARDYVVYDPAGNLVCRGFSCPDTAARKADQLDYDARLVDRNCITCRDVFKSEGPHNRMCDPCRERAPSIDVIGHPVGLPTRTGRGA